MATSRKFQAKNGLDNNNNTIDNLGAAGSSLALAGAFAVTLTSTGTTNVTLPTTGILYSGSMPPVAGGVIYGASATQYGSTAVGVAKQVLASNAAAAPTWATLDLTYLPDSWVKKSVRAASTVVQPITARTATTLTIGGTALTYDGVVLANGDRVLVKNGTSGTGAGLWDNGIYTVSGIGTAVVLTRADDADTASELGGATVNVDLGTINGGLTFTNNFKTTDTVGTTVMTWAQFITSVDSAGYVLKTGDTMTGALKVSMPSANSSAFLIDSAHVNGAYMQIQSSGVTKGYMGIAAGLTSGTANDLAMRSEGQLFFATGGTTARMQIDATGNVGIGVVPNAAQTLRLTKPLTGSTTVYGIVNNGVVQVDATVAAYGHYSGLGTVAAAFALPALYHNMSAQGTFGAGSTVTAQFGFYAHASLIGAANNYGYYGGLAAATGRWNLYMAGTADNFLAGKLLISSNISVSNKVGSGTYTSNVQLNGVATASSISLNTFSADATGPVLIFGKSRNATVGGQTIVAVGDVLGNLTFGGSDGAVIMEGARIRSVVEGTPGVDSIESNLEFLTADSASQFVSTKMQISAEGNVGIPAAAIGTSLAVGKTVTGSSTSFGITSIGVAQIDVTTAAYGIFSKLGTVAAAVTVPDIYQFGASQGTFGVGSTVTNQYGFYANALLIGAVNNFGFYGNIAASLGRWNLYMNGTANNFIGGPLYRGSDTPDSFTVAGTLQSPSFQNISSAVVGSTLAMARYNNSTGYPSLVLGKSRASPPPGQSIVLNNDILGSITWNGSDGVKMAEAANIYVTVNGAPALDSIPSSMSFLTTSAGAVTPSLKMQIDAAGNVGIGSVAAVGQTLRVSKNITGATTAYGIVNNGTVQADVTGTVYVYHSNVTTAAVAFTLGTLYHYIATPTTIGAGSAITTQIGYGVSSSLTAATSNYGFWGNVPAATGRWNLYMGGTAQNFIQGNLGIGTGKTVPAQALDVAGNIVASGTITGSSFVGGASLNVLKAGDTMTGALILNADPTIAMHAATKQYVDNMAAGLVAKVSVITATTTTLAASSAGTVTYANGTAGVGATLTTTGTFNTIGGATVANGNRVLVKDEVATANNGIYTRTSATVLTRATDFDDSPDGEVDSGDFTFVSTGTIAGTNWVLTTPAPITIGTTGLVFSQLSGGATYTAGPGISINANQISNTGIISATGTALQVTVSAPDVNRAITIGLPTAVTITGAMTAGSFVGSGASLTNIPNAALTNSTITVGTTAIALGAAATTIAGLVSVTSTTFVGALSGNATTATSATTATNVAGGVAGNILYQSAVNATAKLANGTTGQVLITGAAPSWATLDLSYLPDAWVKKAVKASTTAVQPVTARTATTLTIGGTALTYDGVVLGNGDRVLVKNGTSGTGAGLWDNGIYTVSGVGTAVVLTRATDADTSSEVSGAMVNVDQGTVNGGLAYTNNFKTTDTLGTTVMNWSQVLTSVDSAGYVLKAGDTMTGALTINAGGGTALYLNAPNVNSAQIQLGTANLARWLITKTNAAEAASTEGPEPQISSNVGSDLQINRHDDAGVYIATPISINRSTGLITTEGSVTVYRPGAVNSQALVSINADVASLQLGSNNSAYGTTTAYGTPSETFIRPGSSSAGLYINSSKASSYIRLGVNNTELVRLTSTGQLIFAATSGETISANGGSSVNARLQILGSTLATSSATLARYFNDEVGSVLTFGKSRGASPLLHARVQGWDHLGDISWNGSDGTVMREAAKIYCYIDGTPAAGYIPGAIALATNPPGSNYAINRITIGSAGDIGMGTNPVPGNVLRIVKIITGDTTAIGIALASTIQSDVTVSAIGIHSNVGTTGSVFTLASLTHFYADPYTFGSGSVVTSQYGFYAQSTLTGATSNYGFYGNIAAATGRWNLYMAGTAQNYFAGNVGIGVTVPTTALDVAGTVKATAFSGPLTGTATALAGGAAGQVPYQSAVGVTAFLAVGATNQVLVTGTSAPSWKTLDLTYLPDAWVKKSARVATTADLAASSFAAGVLTGFDDSIVLNCTTTLASATVTTTSTAGLKIGATLAINASFPTAKTIASITNTTTFVINDGTDVVAGAAVPTTFTQTIAALVIDGVTLVLNDRVLVKNQTATLQNGIYYVSTLGTTTVPWVLTRATDADTSSEVAGAQLNIDAGTANGGLGFRTNFVVASVINTTAMLWYQVYTSVDATTTNTANKLVLRDASGNFAAGTITAALTGAASLNVAKTGDTMTGALSISVPVASSSAFSINSAHASGSYMTIQASGAAKGYLGSASALSSGTVSDIALRSEGQLYLTTGGSAYRVHVDSVGNTAIGGTAALAGQSLRLTKNMTGSTYVFGIVAGGTIQSDVTFGASIFHSSASTASVAFTIPFISHFNVNPNAIGAGSIITNQYGFRVQGAMDRGGFNYGFYGELTVWQDDWNIYMAGDAQNYFAGNVGIGVGKSRPTVALDVAGDVVISGSITAGSFVGSFAATDLGGGAAGQILYQAAVNDTAFLAVGTTNQVLVTGATPSWKTLDLTYLPDAWVKKAVRAASTAVQPVTARTATTLTIGGTALTYDGIVLANGDRVLVKNSTSGTGAGLWDNGIYTVSGIGTAVLFTRAADADATSEIAGAMVNVDQGTVNGGQVFTNTFKTTDTVGTTAMNWYQDYTSLDATTTNTANKLVLRDASGNFAAGTITAALSGNATTATTATLLAIGSGVNNDMNDPTTFQTGGRILSYTTSPVNAPSNNTGHTALTIGRTSDSGWQLDAVANAAITGFWCRTGNLGAWAAWKQLALQGDNVTFGTLAGTQMNVNAGTLATTVGAQVTYATMLSNSSNGDQLIFSDLRLRAGTDWSTAGQRIQAKVDSTWMGYIQFNGGDATTGNNAGISFGTGTTTVGASSIVERMRIDSAGSVGIGVVPTYKLDVSQGGGNAAVVDVMRLFASASATASARMLFGTSANVLNAAIVGQTLTATGGSLQFQTAQEGTGTLTERMRITSGGDVGVGNVAPTSIAHGGSARILHIHNADTAQHSQAHVMLTSGGEAVAGSAVGAISWGKVTANKLLGYIGMTNGSTDSATVHSALMSFATKATTDGSATERMRISESGSVGIGTTNPTVIGLTIGNAARTGENYLLLQTSVSSLYVGQSAGTVFGQASGNIALVAQFGAKPLGIGTNTAQSLILATSDAPRVTINAIGHVGVGVTPQTWPTAFKLIQVGAGTIFNGNSAGTDIALSVNQYWDGTNDRRINLGGTSRITFNGTDIYFERSASGAAGSIISYSESMRIFDNGYVSFGTTGKMARIGIKGVSITAAPTSVDALGDNAIRYEGTTTASGGYSGLTFSSGGGGGAAILFSRGGSYDTQMRFYTNSVSTSGAIQEKMTLDSAGGLNVVGSVTSPSFVGLASNASTLNQNSTDNLNFNTYFLNTAPGTSRWSEASAATNAPGGDWWFVKNYKHTNGTNTYGVQHALGWQGNWDEFYTRRIVNGAFDAWTRYLNTRNYNAYAPTLTGGGASGTWAINASGYSNYLNAYAWSSASGVQTGRSVYANGGYTYSTIGDPNSPASYMAAVGFGVGVGGAAEICVNWISAGQGMWYRSLRDMADPWTGWTNVVDSANFWASYMSPYCTSITKLGIIATINGYTPKDGCITLTPNLHLNAMANNAVILNWSNGGSGTAKALRIGNGAAADVWWCQHDGGSWQSGGHTLNGLYNNNFYYRNSHQTGCMVGGHTNLGDTSAKTSPIYCIGSGYVPAETTLVDMYGIGFASNTATFKPANVAGWGMYVAADGDARVWLDGSAGLVIATGDIIAYSSDARLKTNVTPIANALDKLEKIRGVEFDWLEGIEESHGFRPTSMHETGVIAQEVQAVIPDAVVTAPFNNMATKIRGVDDNFLTVNKEKIIPLLIEAVKELSAQNKELLRRLNDLENSK